MPSDPLTRAELDAALALANAATPGPWEAQELTECDCDECAAAGKALPHHDSAWVPKAAVVEESDGDTYSRENADLMAASRELVPRLVEDVKRWRRRWAEQHYHDTGFSVGCQDCSEARSILAEET